MKFNLDSLLYIVITIAILVISGLGSRRKKKLQQMQAPSPPGNDADLFEPEEPRTSFSDRIGGPGSRIAADPYQPLKSKAYSAPRQVINPMQRLEEFLTGQVSTYESMEGESMETTMDEEEMILEQIRKDREEVESGPKSVVKPIDEEPEIESIESVTRGKKDFAGLFYGAGEIKRAIIYSEILKRKYD